MTRQKRLEAVELDLQVLLMVPESTYRPVTPAVMREVEKQVLRNLPEHLRLDLEARGAERQLLKTYVQVYREGPIEDRRVMALRAYRSAVGEQA